MVLHGLELEYDKFEDQWVSMGDIGVATLGKARGVEDIRGKVALDWDDQIIHIYFHLSGQQWYYMEWNAKLGYFRIHPKDPCWKMVFRWQRKSKDSRKGTNASKRTEVICAAIAQPQQPNRRDFVDMFREFDD